MDGASARIHGLVVEIELAETMTWTGTNPLGPTIAAPPKLADSQRVSNGEVKRLGMVVYSIDRRPAENQGRSIQRASDG